MRDTVRRAVLTPLADALTEPIHATIEDILAENPLVTPGELDDVSDDLHAARSRNGHMADDLGLLKAEIAEFSAQLGALTKQLVETRGKAAEAQRMARAAAAAADAADAAAEQAVEQISAREEQP